MPIAIQSAVNIIKINSDKQIVLTTDDGEMRIMVSDIMYFETDGRKLLILLSNERKILTNKTIIEMLELINKENFVTIHRSCVVNTDYVKNMHNTILTLKNGHQLATSRRKYKDIKRQILNLWGEQLCCMFIGVLNMLLLLWSCFYLELSRNVQSENTQNLR